MTKLEFVAVWDKMTSARKGAAVEAFFKKTHAGAEPVRSDFIDFKYQGESLDIKSHKAACPKLNQNQIDKKYRYCGIIGTMLAKPEMNFR